jgi:four helix bundle protein
MGEHKSEIREAASVEAKRCHQKYDLEERTFQFARRIRQFVTRIQKTLSNYEDSKQLISASGSVGANYIEANESLGDKDFLLPVKISRKESKECHYWLRLLDLARDPGLEPERSALLNEATELMRILAAIIRKRSA